MPKQTFEDIIECEKQMLLDAPERYGEFWGNAYGFVVFMQKFIKSINDPEKFIFLAFLSQVKKHLTLALFSSVRFHHTQAGMNMRQVLEASSWAAYGMAFKDENLFYEEDTDTGIVFVPEKLNRAKNKWLDENFKIKSDEILRLKTMLNEQVAHSNIVYAYQNFRHDPRENLFELPFFDFEHENKVKADLWFVANTALGLIDLFVNVNNSYRVFTLSDDFSDQFRQLVELNNKLKEEVTGSEGYKDAQKILSKKITKK